MEKIKDFKDMLKVYGLATVLVAIGFYVAYQFVGPAPTKNINIATGGSSGADYQFAQQYANRFAKDGVELTVLETAGSIDNLSQLMEDGRNVQAALIQGGIGTPEQFPILESLGSLYYEPLWLFHAQGIELETLGDLKGRRIAIGNQGSGTYSLAARLLAENGVTPETARFLEISGQEGIDALTANQADAIFVVAGVASGTVKGLLTNSAVSLYSFRRAEAYTRNFKFLSKIILPRGSVDFQQNIPANDTILVAPSANLIIRNDLHPALMYLFMIAAQETHQMGGLLEDRGAFPNPEAAGFPLNKQAHKYYQSGGPPFLMRVLPFWLATWLVRMFVMLIPLITILYPLIKIAPPTYTWRVRRKVNKLYKRLHRLEMDFAEAREEGGAEAFLKRLDVLDQKATALHVPASYLSAQYELRRHIDLMRGRLSQAQISAQSPMN